METMENMELDDLVYTYPDQYNPDIQTLISAKEEFKEIEGLPTEAPPKRGQLYRHQKVLKRLMLQYDQQMVVAGTGTGKTCSIYSVTEHYKALAGALEEIRTQSNPTGGYTQTKTLAPAFKRVYILVKGQNLVDEMKFQLLCKCTAGDYITQQIIDSKTERQRKSNITRSISKYYTIQTYVTFAKELLEYSEERLIQEFSNCIFVVDEFHNINDDNTGGILRKDPITGNEFYVHIKKGEEKIMENRLVYDQLFRLFHKTFPRKVMLLSATPMINDASEIGPRLNLILPLDRQIPKDINWKTVTIEQLEPYFRGMISYVRSLDTGAIPVYQGNTIQARYRKEDIETLNDNNVIDERALKSQMIVYASQMEDKQGEVYRIADEEPWKLIPDSQNPEAFDNLKRQAANFVFPDNTTGSDGYKKYVIENKNGFAPTEEFKIWLRDGEKLRQMSSKYYEIVRLCREEPGNCWVYSHYVRTTGAIVLGLCFEYQGFERFSEARSIFSMTGEGGLAPVCGGKSLDEVKGDRFVRIPKKLRYAVLTPETAGPEQTALLEAFNSYENRYGEYIKAIIGSPVTRDGLNFANVLQIHLSGPAWNQASSYQAESRAIRSTSHVDLLEEEKQRLIREGKDPENAYIEIKVYRHAAVNDEGDSVDIKMYQESEIKDRQIKRIMRMMKIVATDCQINYKRNVRPGDVDYSPTCDYDICQYKCYSPLPENKNGIREVDYSSYDVLYSNDIVEAAKSHIKDIFRVIFSISFDELYGELKEYRRKFIDIAVASLIEIRTPITDRYGFSSYLREDGGVLFLRSDYPLTLTEKRGGVSILEYTSNLIGTKTTSLEEYNGVLQLGSGGKEKGILSIISGLSPADANAKINTLTLENKINLLEAAINSYYIEGKKLEEAVIILQKFKSSIFIEYEPQKALDLSNKFFSERGKGRGRKPKEGSKFKLNPKQEKEILNVIDKRNKNVIYFHNLSGVGQAQTSYALTAKSRKTKGKIRLFNALEKIGWRDTNEAENVVYNEIIKIKQEQEKTGLDIYGTVIEDKEGEFRIVDKTTEDKTRAAKDTRSLNRGRRCRDGWKVPELVNLLWKIQYDPFDVELTQTNEEMTVFISGKNIASYEEVLAWPRERKEFYYKWGGIARSKICELLEKHFEDTGRIVRD